MEVTHSTLDHSAYTTLHHKDDGWEFPILMSMREIQPDSMPENPIWTWGWIQKTNRRMDIHRLILCKSGEADHSRSTAR